MTQGDWKEWLEHPVTVIYRQLLVDETSETNGTMYNPKSVEQTALNCAHAVGFAEGIELALGLEPEFE